MSADATHREDALVGHLIGDRYRVLAPLGRGGMGAVYRVEHVMLKKELALKFLHPELGQRDELARRFEREAEAAAKLDHPNIVQVTDFGRTPDGMPFLVMELLAGQSLTEVIRPNGAGQPLPLARALHIERQILHALEHAHASGIVHRDLKPDNIMLIARDDERDVVKLLDFGIAKVLASKEGEASHGETLTQAGMVFGTPEYLSPEQAMGEEADGRADLYAAGVVLYEMLTGRRPFEAASKVAVVSMHLTQKALPVTQAAPMAALPPWVDGVVERAMAKKRDERFASAAAFLAALEPAARHRAIPPASPWQVVGSGWSFLVRRARMVGVPWPRLFVGGALLLLISLLAIVGLFRKSSRLAPPAVAASVAHAEQLLAHGELGPARAALQQLVATHPEAARVHYLLGNLDYAQGERERALDDYHHALARDATYASDRVLRGNVRALLDRREGLAAVTLLADDIGKPALDDLIDCAKSCRDLRTRRRAAEAVAHLGGPSLLAKLTPPEDEYTRAAERLRSGKSCRERKAAALELIASGDHRFLDSLRAARSRRGGFLGLEPTNGCMRRELDAAIRKWESN